MARTRDNILATLAGLLDRMEQRMQADIRLTGFGRSALATVLEQLRSESLRTTPDEQRIRDALQTWTSVTGEELLADRMLSEFRRLRRAS